MTSPVGAAANFPPRQSVGRIVLVVVIFGVAFAMNCRLLDRYLPFPLPPDVSPRFHYFAERKDDFDTIFVGSSRIRNQIIPRQFDAETAARGAATHSMNLGYSGMWPPESYYFLRQLLALHPRHLRWVVIELMDYRFGKAEHQPLTMHMIYWHDWKHTAMAFRIVTEWPQSLLEKVEQFATHAWMYLLRLSNPGGGADWVKSIFFPAKDKSDTSWIERGGFDPAGDRPWSEAGLTEYAQSIQAFQQLPTPPRLRPGLDSALREIIDEVRGAGAEPLFVLAPSVRPEEKLAYATVQGATVWAFDDPAEFPRLYLPQLHHDAAHLNEEGAREFTSLLAQRLADLAERR